MMWLTLTDLQPKDKFTSIWCLVGGKSNPDTLLQHTHILTRRILPQSTPVTAKQDGLACCHSPPLPTHTTHSVKVKDRIRQQSLKTRTDIKAGISTAKYRLVAFLRLQSVPVLRCQNTRAQSRLIRSTNSYRHPLQMGIKMTAVVAKNTVSFTSVASAEEFKNVFFLSFTYQHTNSKNIVDSLIIIHSISCYCCIQCCG